MTKQNSLKRFHMYLHLRMKGQRVRAMLLSLEPPLVAHSCLTRSRGCDAH